MKKTYALFAVLLIAAAALIVFTMQSPESPELPDLSMMGKVTVIAREEGSGTKDAYRQLVGTYEEGANKIAISTNQAIEFTAEDKNAIAYVAYSTVAEAKNVKILSVNNVPATYNHISSSKYPLVRPYLLAYKGELSDLEVDFLTYIHGAGQRLVAEHITPNRKPTSFLSNQAEGNLTINGSSSVAPLMEALVKEYCTYNKNAKIEVQVTDSTGGINTALRGDCDLAMSSRALKSYEAELLTVSVIGTDGVAVIVNAENPVTGLSLQQIKAIYDGKVPSWSDLK